MMQERGVDVDPTTIVHWVHRYAPELEKRVRWYQEYRTTSWRVDETYVKASGSPTRLLRQLDRIQGALAAEPNLLGVNSDSVTRSMTGCPNALPFKIAAA